MNIKKRYIFLSGVLFLLIVLLPKIKKEQIIESALHYLYQPINFNDNLISELNLNNEVDLFQIHQKNIKKRSENNFSTNYDYYRENFLSKNKIDLNSKYFGKETTNFESRYGHIKSLKIKTDGNGNIKIIGWYYDIKDEGVTDISIPGEIFYSQSGKLIKKVEKNKWGMKHAVFESDTFFTIVGYYRDSCFFKAIVSK